MGELRLFLSLLIVFVHATRPDGHAVASIAVFIFFGISGYGCTAAITTKYKGQPCQFLLNRWVRLWPSYLVIFALSSVAWVLVGDLHNTAMPSGLNWLGQFSMLWMPSVGRLVPTAWVLPYMFIAYAAIALGATATPNRAAIVLGASLIWCQYDALTMSGGVYAGSWGAWALSTSAGAVIYWIAPALPRGCQWSSVVAFPIFLSHYLMLALLIAAGMTQGWPLFFASLPPTIALSWLLVLWVERPIDRYRKRFRKTVTQRI